MVSPRRDTPMLNDGQGLPPDPCMGEDVPLPFNRSAEARLSPRIASSSAQGWETTLGGKCDRAACRRLSSRSGCYTGPVEQLAVVVQFVGTLVTVAGLVVVAPYAVGRAIPDAWRATAGARNRVHGWAARLLPWLRGDAAVHAVSASLNGTIRITGEAFGRVGPGSVGTVEEQLASLRRAVESIHAELDGLRTGQTALRAELVARLERLEAAQDELRQAVEAQQDERAKLDARGIPLAAVGALLAGWPAVWLPWWLAVVLLLVAGMAAVAAVRWLRGRPSKPGAGAEVRSGWQEGWREVGRGGETHW